MLVESGEKGPKVHGRVLIYPERDRELLTSLE
jgi:hypothetical protein